MFVFNVYFILSAIYLCLLCNKSVKYAYDCRRNARVLVAKERQNKKIVFRCLEKRNVLPFGWRRVPQYYRFCSQSALCVSASSRRHRASRNICSWDWQTNHFIAYLGTKKRSMSREKGFTSFLYKINNNPHNDMEKSKAALHTDLKPVKYM